MPDLSYVNEAHERIRKDFTSDAAWIAYRAECRQREQDEATRLIALSDATKGPLQTALRDGFLRGYLQAYRDGDEYGCSIERAKIAHGLAVERGQLDAPLADVEGW